MGRSAQASSPPSCLPVSRAASRWRCSSVRLATKSARGSAVGSSAVGSFADSASPVQRAVQRAEGLDVTSDRFSLASDRPLTPELKVAGSNPAGHTNYKPAERNDLRTRLAPQEGVRYALGHWQSGQTEVTFRTAESGLSELLREFGPPRKSDHPEPPFWRLQNDGLWVVHAPPGTPLKTNDDIPRVSALRSPGVQADVQAVLANDPDLVARDARSGAPWPRRSTAPSCRQSRMPSAWCCRPPFSGYGRGSRSRQNRRLAGRA